MKRLIALLLTLVMVFALCACGGSNEAAASESRQDNDDTNDGNIAETVTDVKNNETPNTDAKSDEIEVHELKIGETAKTDQWEFTLTDFQFGEALSGDYLSDDYLLPVTAPTGAVRYKAEDGQTLISVSFSMKYLGKTEFNLTNSMHIDYNDGFMFSKDANDRDYYSVKDDDSWKMDSYVSFKPLSDEQELRRSFSVPVEVEENEDAPLKLRVFLFNDDGTTTRFDYIIR